MSEPPADDGGKTEPNDEPDEYGELARVACVEWNDIGTHSLAGGVGAVAIVGWCRVALRLSKVCFCVANVCLETEMNVSKMYLK